MKRIAICWRELAAEGNAVALHVNARTPKDFSRWGDFLIEHSEISSIAFEFQTGAASPVRGDWHADRLCKLAKQVGRQLQLVSFGGLRQLAELKRAFTNLVYVTSTPSMKSSHYRKLLWESNSSRHPREIRSDLKGDDLLEHNIGVYDKLVNSVLSAA